MHRLRQLATARGPPIGTVCRYGLWPRGRPYTRHGQARGGVERVPPAPLQSFGAARPCGATRVKAMPLSRCPPGSL